VQINFNFEAYIAENVTLAVNITNLDIQLPGYFNNTVTVKLLKTKAALSLVEGIVARVINEKIG
jgi:hypothetical protein